MPFEIKFVRLLEFEYEEFNGDAHFFCFHSEILYMQNMQNSLVLFTLFRFGWKYSFWTNLVQKIKIVSFCRNLLSRLIWVCRIQWCCSPFLFWTGSTVLSKFNSKKLKVSLTWNLVRRQYKYADFNSRLVFPISTRYTLIVQICSKKSEVSVKAEISYLR